MSSLPEWSNRRSVRVDLEAPSLEVRSTLRHVKAPESISPQLHPALIPERRASRVSHRGLEFIDKDLSEREQAILRSLDDFRFLTSGQIQFLHFHNHSTPTAAGRIARRVLKRLNELRIIEHLQRRIGGIRAGSSSYVWRVGPVGDRLLRQESTESVRARRKEPSMRHLDHCLTIAECAIAAVTTSRAGALELIQTQTEPNCWRTYLGAGGSREILKPDLELTTASGEFEDRWFIEVDRSTESIPTVLRKCAQYVRYRRIGREQAEYGVFPLVVWVVPDEKRADQLQRAMETSRDIDQDLFRVSTTDTFIETILQGAT